MTAPVDQLHYTWARRGIEGANQFQIAAVSDGLRGGSAMAAMPMVQRLCRYDPPPGARDDFPVSFGWLDYESHRIAFRRIGLPPDRGQPGNFAAHFLVAAPSALPEAAIALLFGSSFWWDGPDPGEAEGSEGEGPNFALPQLRLGDIPRDERDPGAEVLNAAKALLYCIFNRPPRTRLAVVASAEETGEAVKAAVRLAPCAFAGLSFSTYEGEPVFPFDITTAGSAGLAESQCSLRLPEDLGRAARAALDGFVGPGDLAGAAARATRRLGGGGSPVGFWEAAQGIVGLSQGLTPQGLAQDDLLADPAAISFLCDTPGGCVAVAAAACRGEPRVLAALREACAEMRPAAAAGLAAAIARRYRVTRELAGCAAVLGALGSAAEEAAEVALEIALEDEATTQGFDGEDAAVLVKGAARRGMDARAARPLLRAASRHISRCAREREVPESYLAAMFEVGLAGHVTEGKLAEAVRTRPALLSEVQLDGVENERCLEVLRPLIASLPPVAVARCVAGLPSKRRAAGMPLAFSLICQEIASALLLAGEGQLARTMLELSHLRDGRRALELLREVGHGPRAAAAAVRGAYAVEDPALRRALTEFALDHAVGAAAQAADVGAVWAVLEELYPSDSAPDLLRRLSACARRPLRETAAAEILAWVALSLAPAHPKLFSRPGKIRDEQSDEWMLELAGGVSSLRLALIGESLGEADHGLRKWWKRLEKQARKR